MKPKIISVRWLIILLIIFLSSLILTGPSGIISLLNAHNKNKDLENKAVELQRCIDSLKITIVRLKTDTAYIERVAREQLGMAKKNEKVYKFVE